MAKKKIKKEEVGCFLGKDEEIMSNEEEEELKENLRRLGYL